MKPIAITACGMVTGVGLNAPASCTAMRAALSGFEETRFLGTGGDWIIGCQVPLEKPWRGIPKLARMAASAIGECLTSIEQAATIPVILCVAEKDRPGRLAGLDDQLLPEVQAILGARFHPRSQVWAQGKVGGMRAVELARQWLHNDRIKDVIVAGVDSYLMAPTLRAYTERYRLLTESNSNGFIPGEGAAAVKLSQPNEHALAEMRVMAIGFGREKATIDSGLPLRGDGLVEAFRNLKVDGGMSLDDADYRYTDCNGEQYGFKNDRLAYARTVRKLKARFDHLHPADSTGEIGAAVVPCMMGLSWTAAKLGYASGDGVLCHCSNDDGDRGAMILRYVRKGPKS